MKFILFSLFSLYAVLSHSQSNKTGSISITVANEDSKNLEDALLNLLSAKDSALIKISITDNKGIAILEDII